MRKIAVLTAAALVAVGALGTPEAEARGGGGAVAAGVIGGLAAGALLGIAVADAHEGPAYGYGRRAPVYAYDDTPPPVRYRPARVVRMDDDWDAPVYRRPRPLRVYGDDAYGYRPAGYGYRRDCDRPDRGYGGW